MIFTDLDDESYLKNKITEKVFSVYLKCLCSRRANIKFIDASGIIALPLEVYALAEIRE